jgi:TRAP-type C4-dicarboxylate transport system substrate-binding protein
MKLTAAVFTAVIALAVNAPAQAQTALKWGHAYETSEPFHTEAVWAAEEIGKRTQGRYKVTVFPASQLGKENDLNQGLTLGAVDLITSGSSYAARSYPPIGVTYYPYIFRNPEHLIAYTKSDVFKELAAGYEKASGHHITAVTYYGTRHTTSNKPIKTCDDLRGIKIRVPDVPAYLAMPKACGANTAPIAFAEVYLALQNGTVDAQEKPADDDRGQEVLRGPEVHRPDRSHYRPRQHDHRRPALGEAVGRGQEDLHRRHPGSGGPCDEDRAGA